jgi:hypothetical protein
MDCDTTIEDLDVEMSKIKKALDEKLAIEVKSLERAISLV